MADLLTVSKFSSRDFLFSIRDFDILETEFS